MNCAAEKNVLSHLLARFVEVLRFVETKKTLACVLTYPRCRKLLSFISVKKNKFKYWYYFDKIYMIEWAR